MFPSSCELAALQFFPGQGCQGELTSTVGTRRAALFSRNAGCVPMGSVTPFGGCQRCETIVPCTIGRSFCTKSV